MWQKDIATLLGHAGWGSGFRLPIASEENLELERELEKKQRIIQAKKAELEDDTRHIAILEAGIKNATDRIAQDIKLVAAKKAEMATEIELATITEKEEYRVTRECQDVKKNFKKALKTNRKLMTELETRRRELAELAEMIEFDRQKLSLLEKKTTDASNLMEMLEDMCEQDSLELSRMDKRYRQAAEESSTLRHELDQKVSMTYVLQAEFDGLTTRFRKLHRERGEVCNIWKDTLDNLGAKDEEMESYSKTYSKAKEELATLKNKLDLEKQKLDERSSVSGSAMRQLDRWDLKCINLRTEIKGTEDIATTIRDNLHSYRSMISVTSAELSEKNRKAAEIEADFKIQRERIQALLARISELKEKIDLHSNKSLTTEENVKEMALIVEEEENKIQSLGKALEKEMIKKTNWVSTWRQMVKEGRDVTFEIDRVKAYRENVQARLRDVGTKLERKRSEFYHLELQYVHIEHRVSSMTDPYANFDSGEFQRQTELVVERTFDLQQMVKKHRYTQYQTNHLSEVEKRVRKELYSAKKEAKEMDEKSREVHILTRAAEKSLVSSGEEFSNVFTDHTLTKLKLLRLKNILKEEKNILFDVGQHRTTLLAAASEKKSEIMAHIRLLEIKRRDVKEDVGQLKLQVTQIVASLDRKRNKYDLIMTLMSSAEDKMDPSDTQSEAYVILKMAQERECLKMEGDKWDAKVKETEAETEALQNSLALIQCSNDLFKDSLKPVADDEITAELNQIKDQEKLLKQKRTKGLATLKQLKIEIDQKERGISELEQDTSRFENKAVDAEYELKVIQGELNNQALSWKRAKMATNKLLLELADHFSNPAQKEYISKDIKLKATRRKFEFGIQALAKLLNVYPVMYKMMGPLLSEKFGDDVATKFLNRISPMLGEASSAQSRQTTATGSRSTVMSTRSATTRTKVVYTREDKVPSAVLEATQQASTTSTTSSIGRQKPGSGSRSKVTSSPFVTDGSIVNISEDGELPEFLVGDGGRIPERTESDLNILKKVAGVVDLRTKEIKEEKAVKKALKKLEKEMREKPRSSKEKDEDEDKEEDINLLDQDDV